jgi:hypothetical protein
VGSNFFWFQKLGSTFCPETDDVTKVEQLVAENLPARFSALGGQNVSKPFLIVDQQVAQSIKQLGPFSEARGLPNRLRPARSANGLAYAR